MVHWQSANPAQACPFAVFMHAPVGGLSVMIRDTRAKDVFPGWRRHGGARRKPTSVVHAAEAGSGVKMRIHRDMAKVSYSPRGGFARFANRPDAATAPITTKSAPSNAPQLTVATPKSANRAIDPTGVR